MPTPLFKNLSLDRLSEVFCYIKAELDKKVTVVSGKGLSTNDYTTTEKNKLSGIASGAEVNVQSDWSEATTSSDAYILNKPTKLSQFTNDVGYTTNIGTVTQVKVGSTAYNPSSGVVSLPAYPTTLPASDVYAWAKASTKPSYTASEVSAVPYKGNLRTEIGADAPAAATKTYFDASVSNLSVEAAYDSNGTEYTLLFSRGGNNQYGSVLKWGYNDEYLRILRVYQGTWKSDDWEKIKAGYADTAGSAPASDVYAWAKASTKPSYSWFEISSKVLDGVNTSDNTFIFAPKSGGWGEYSGSTQTGAIKIAIPQRRSSTMIRFFVDIYTYDGASATTYLISGYSYSDGKWYNYGAKAMSNAANSMIRSVRFGEDSTKACVWIGETNSKWAYLKVRIRDVMLGHSGFDATNFLTGWAVSIVTSFDTVTSTVTDTSTWNISISGNCSGSSGSCTGNAATASKLGSSTVGSATQPIYLNSGTATACTYTLGTNVPSNAVFTDTNTKVTQTAVTASSYTNWRPLVIGSSNSVTEGFSPSTVTDTTITASTISCQPSSGTIKATTFKGALTGNAATATLLSYTHTNEINFKGGAQSTCYFNYRNADTDASATSAAITYKFCNYTSSTLSTTIEAATFKGNLTGSIVPTNDNTVNIGSSNKKCSDVYTYKATISSLYLYNTGQSKIATITFDGATNRSISVPDKSGTIALTSDIVISGTTFYSGNSGTAEHNANSALKNGHYYYTSNGPSGSSSTDGALYVQSYSDTWVGQIAQDYRQGNLFVRGKNNGTWSAWRKVACLYTYTGTVSGDQLVVTHNLGLGTSYKPMVTIANGSGHCLIVYAIGNIATNGFVVDIMNMDSYVPKGASGYSVTIVWTYV